MNNSGISKNIIFFDGSKKNKIFKGEFQFGSEKITRDLTGQSKSELTIYDKDDLIDNLDVFVIGYFLPFQIWGRVAEVEFDSKSGEKKLSLIWGADTHTNDLYSSSSTFIPNDFYEDNEQLVSVKLETNTSISIDDNIINFDSIARKIMISNNHKEIMDNEQIIIKQIENIEYKLRLDDPKLANQEVNISDDIYNSLRLYMTDSPSHVDYYLNEDYEVTTDINEAIRPINRDYEVTDEYNNFEYAENKMNEKKYDNEIIFSVQLENDLPALQFDETFLGRKIRIYLGEDTELKSIISKYEIKGETIDVTCGLSRRRLTELLNKD